MKKTFILALILTGFITPSWAKTPNTDNPYQAAIAAYQRGDFQAAFQQLKPMAEAGDVVAQHNLAVLYQDGLGVSANPTEALKWYERAAEQGSAEAQFMTGLMYSDGIGTEQNYDKAFYWYKKAAEQGHNEAQNNLAARYASGTGVKQNMKEAQKWYQRAAAQGNTQAAYTLQQLKALETKP